MTSTRDSNITDPANGRATVPFGKQLELLVARVRTQGLAGILIILVAFFIYEAPGFATHYNANDLLRDLAILGILVIGETFVLIGGGLDLSVGSVLLVGGIVTDNLIRLAEWNPVAASLVGVAAGCVAGGLNGLLITRLRISPFIVTLATLYVFRGVGLWLYTPDIQNLQAAIIDNENFLILGQGDVLGIPVPFIILCGLLAIGTFVLTRMRFGLYLYAVGGNELAARLTRIHVTRVQLSSYVISGACAALAGVILTSRLQTGAPEAGLGQEFDVIAAAIIGGASLFGGRGTLPGVLLGAAFITVLAKGQTLIGISTNYQTLTRGLVILAAVSLDVVSRSGTEVARKAKAIKSCEADATAVASLGEAHFPELDRGVPALRAVALSKSFSEIRAVDEVDFEVLPGEVHAIVGENGAGKSTLIKMFSGVLRADSGSLSVGRTEVVFDDVASAQDHGIAVIYQDRAVVPELTVVQNIMLGHEPAHKIPGVIDRTELRARAQRVWAMLGSPAPLDAVVRDLSPSVQQVVDIARALAFDAQVVIMDEPTAALTREETLRLFAIIRKLQRSGTAVIYISHDLEEIFEVARRVTVLRDGKRVGTVDVADVSRQELIRMMIGREIDETARMGHEPSSRQVLVVNDLRRSSVLDGISFTVCAGEIVGIAGLVGSGRTELLRAIFGADRLDSGNMVLQGEPYAPKSPRDAVRANIGFVPEDRKREGLVFGRSIRDNLSLPNFDMVSNRRLWFDNGKEERLASKMIGELKIEPPVSRWHVNHLSGGNQQKVVLGKWLARRPALFLIDEPTQGVDVGAREEIYRAIGDLAKSGTAVLVVSSYLPEVLRLSDRILVMRDGKIALDIPREGATEEILLSAATKEIS